MDNELEAKNLNNRCLSESYDDGVERISGSKNNSPFKLPSEILKKREQFWEDFFKKYTQQSLMENDRGLSDSYASAPHKKSLKFVQHWIDNGTLPYKSMVNIDKQLEQGRTDKMSENSSISSVDTAVYILSNMNTTNKVDAMAIVEGAKHSTLRDIENEDLESMETIKLNRDKVCGTDNKSSVQHNGKNNSLIMSLTETDDVLFERSVVSKGDTTQVGKYLHTHINEITAPKPTSNKLLTEELMHLISKSTQKRSLNTEFNESSQTYMTEENSMWQNNSTKLSQRRKLYSGRDSPVDIVFTNRRNRHVIPKSKQCLHPALDTEHKIRRDKYLSKRRVQRMSMYRNSMMSNSILSLASVGRRKRKRSTFSKAILPNVNGLKIQETELSSIDANNTIIGQNNHNIDSSLIISNGCESGDTVKAANEFKKPDSTTRIIKKRKLGVGSQQVSKSQLLQHKKPSEVTALQNLNPIVCLEKLSEIEMKKYKKPKSSISYFDNLLSPVVRLDRLSNSDIQKYKEVNKVFRNVGNSASEMYLKQSSEVAPKEGRKVEKMVTSPCNLNPTVCLTRLSERDTKTVMSDMNPSALNENNLLFQTTRTRNNDISSTKKTLYSQNTSNNLLQNNNTIHLFEDSDSTQSTLLIHECENLNLKIFTDNLRSTSNAPLGSKLEIADNKIRKKNKMCLLNNATDKCNDNCIRETRNSERNKGVKPNNEIECGLNFSKSKITNNNNNNIYHIEIVNDMPNVSNYSYKNSCKQTSKPKLNKKGNFLILPDDGDEFVKLIPKSRRRTFRNSLDTDTSDTDTSCNTVTRTLRSQSSSTSTQSSVKSTFRDLNFRKLRKKVVPQKQKNVNVGKPQKRLDINYLRFQTRFDTDSEASSCC